MFEQGVQDAVELLLVTDEPASELEELLTEVADQSEHVSYRRMSGSEARAAGLDASLMPVVLLGGGDSGYSRARFLGIPAGHEFGVLIQDIIDLSQQQIQLTEETKRFLDGLQEDLHLMVFTTPT